MLCRFAVARVSADRLSSVIAGGDLRRQQLKGGGRLKDVCGHGLNSGGFANQMRSRHSMRECTRNRLQEILDDFLPSCASFPLFPAAFVLSMHISTGRRNKMPSNN